jgi:heme exporter protein B
MSRALWRRELQLKWHQAADWLHPILFFLMVLVLFPLAIGAQPNLLARVGGAAVWIAALLSVLIGMEGLFRRDLEEGTLEQLVVLRASLAHWALAKVTVHWLGSGLVVALLSGLALPLFHLQGAQAWALFWGLLLGLPVLTLLAALGAALTVSLRAGGLLVPLIALPLQLPVLIFASGLVNLAGQGDPVLPVLALLGALLIVALLALPWAIGAALRLAVQ